MAHGTLTEEALSLLLDKTCPNFFWGALKEAYAQDSREKEFILRRQLIYLCKDENTTIGEHIFSISRASGAI